jgi:glycerol kinase
MGVLSIDIGTSGVKAAVIEADGSVTIERYREALPDSPAAGLVEFDAAEYGEIALAVAREVLAEVDQVAGVGITNQRGSAVVWDRATGLPVAPAQGWQDLRTIGDCLVMAAEGIRFAPNQMATKAANIWDAVDPERARDLCVGTPDSWLIWLLTNGELHVTDPTNAGITGLLRPDGATWDAGLLERLRIPERAMPTIVDSSGVVGPASVLAGAPPIAGIAGDQQASLIGQGGVFPGVGKITFGTGAMLDVCLGTDAPEVVSHRSRAGTYPIVCWRRDEVTMWGAEAIMLAAGTNVQWLRDDLGLISTSAESADVAAQCETSEGVVYVPAQLGLGTPHWDYGARGALFGLTRGSSRSHIVRAVLEGVAQRGADMVEAIESDHEIHLDTIRVDGGMCENPVFCQALADATQRTIEVAPQKEATIAGAAALAGLAVGVHGGWDDVARIWDPSAVYRPGDPLDRKQWARAIERAGHWYEDLSALDF